MAFSDLSWETVIGDADIPMFPQAKQVGEYLAAYAERYIPKEMLRLGSRVIRTARTVDAQSGARWKVQWIKERFVFATALCLGHSLMLIMSSAQASNHYTTPPENELLFTEDFDFLVVASGYFARPHVPPIPGLEDFTGRVLHSSAMQKGRDPFDEGAGTTSGNVAIIGGSMSGVEAASAAALSQSSATFVSAPSDRHKTRPAVHHIYSRPFWALPTYLPHESSDDTVTFLPLDLAMYDLGRRPPGPVEYALGQISEEKASKTNRYFATLLGPDYEKIGRLRGSGTNDKAHSRPPWVAIGNEYAEFIRSGAIKATMGRPVSIHSDPQTGLASIKIKTSDHLPEILEDISHVVMATGFTPFEALSFLPADVLATLEYSTEDQFLPLILDQGGTLRSEMRDIGFVGFYRGPYWGVMEMQARFLGKAWLGDYEVQRTENQRQNLRDLRQPDSESRRGQFPMGDYVGLMESFAKDLEIDRIALSDDDDQSGPVIPARYVYTDASAKSDGESHDQRDLEAERTLDDVRAAYLSSSDTAQTAAALAIFRALHGAWKLTRWLPAAGEKVLSGTAIFQPRYPTDSAYDREYVDEENLVSSSANNEPSSENGTASIFRLSGGGTDASRNRIEIWPARTSEHASTGFFLNLTPFYRKKRDGESITGEYVIHASSGPLIHTKNLASGSRRYQYTFNFNGVSISSWECLDLGHEQHAGGENLSEDQPTSHCRSLYER